MTKCVTRFFLEKQLVFFGWIEYTVNINLLIICLNFFNKKIKEKIIAKLICFLEECCNFIKIKQPRRLRLQRWSVKEHLLSRPINF